MAARTPDPSVREDLRFEPSRIDDLELKAFLQFREHGHIPLRYAIPLGIKALLTDVPFAVLKHWPGPVGMKLRQFYYRLKFAHMGSNVLVGTGVEAVMPSRISVSDFVLIDNNVSLQAMAGRISIGRRIHIAPNVIISGTASEVILGDYAAVGAFARVYAHSEAPVDGKRVSGPMIPESMKGMITAPVHIGKDALIGTGAVVLPGVTVGEGAVVGANSLIAARARIPPWSIFAGVPARFVGMRQKVTVPDI